LVEEMERDSDFETNSRRVRLEALANYCRTALKFFDTGALKQKKQLFKGPDLTKITQVMPDLEPIIQARWLEAQRCQHSSASLVEEMERDSDFETNSRRVRLEALANYCRTALKFFDTGALKQKKQLFKGPDLTKITQVMPDLEPIIQARWLEAQRCQHSSASL